MSQEYKIVLYKTQRGSKIIENYIDDQNSSTKTKIVNIFRLLREYGFNLLKTHWMKKIHSHPALYELRVKSINEYRFMLVYHENIFTILSGFVKKTQKTPKEEISLAIKRYKEFCC
ncbi:hypothetical protein CO007_00575 [Candidatus Roizmanbacteria bacterium CG_4_8_14_3_um_filter_36_10]|uniref:Type II toxin-antitoxin system RelE/ParE family toxin n=1 Tax=Candidatus Roizmanbacteria bacterium CG_4_8_14_3_um_filter_36_10 TaxID=1974834 RepID=A0A2M8GP20_9BACT|nr:MAG: hypothetical protein CO007_00575 [Candidatus Roizmanbacteria bacterium CG_4_8_14_3_um_filter_36_10]